MSQHVAVLTGSSDLATDIVHSARLRSAATALFPSNVALSIASRAMYDAPLVGRERLDGRMMSWKRAAEFRAGRAAAREALRLCGHEGGDLPRQLTGAPRWPEGFIGSITHCEGFCGAVTTRSEYIKSIGFDVEPSSSVTEDIMDMVCTEAELLNAGEHSSSTSASLLGTAIFSAKEAFYKAAHPLVGEFVGFLDVSVQWECGVAGGIFSIHHLDSKLASLCDRWHFSGLSTVTEGFSLSRMVAIDTLKRKP